MDDERRRKVDELIRWWAARRGLSVPDALTDDQREHLVERIVDTDRRETSEREEPGLLRMTAYLLALPKRVREAAERRRNRPRKKRPPSWWRTRPCRTGQKRVLVGPWSVEGLGAIEPGTQVTLVERIREKSNSATFATWVIELPDGRVFRAFDGEVRRWTRPVKPARSLLFS